MEQLPEVDAVVITVKGQAKICAASDCKTFLTNPKIPRGQEFYLLLEIQDPAFRSIYYPNLTQAFVMGNGTMITLPIDYSKARSNKDNSAIYALMMPLTVFNGYLALKAELRQIPPT